MRCQTAGRCLDAKEDEATSRAGEEQINGEGRMRRPDGEGRPDEALPRWLVPPAARRRWWWSGGSGDGERRRPDRGNRERRLRLLVGGMGRKGVEVLEV